PDEVTTPFDVYQSELQGTNANILLEATNSISSPDTFSVRILDGNSLTMVTRNDSADATGSTFAPGIHLAGVSFQTGGTGAIALSTGTGAETGVTAGIQVGNLTTAGGSVGAATEDGDIQVGAITTTGVDGAAGGNGGAVTLNAARTGSVTVAGAIDARG